MDRRTRSTQLPLSYDLDITNLSFILSNHNSPFLALVNIPFTYVNISDLPSPTLCVQNRGDGENIHTFVCVIEGMPDSHLARARF